MNNCPHCGDPLIGHNWCGNCGDTEVLDEFKADLAIIVNDLLDWIEKRESHHMPLHDRAAVVRAYRAVGREPLPWPLDLDIL